MIKAKKSLSLSDSISLIVSSIVGAGIFESAPLVAKSCNSIEGVLILWFLGGILSLFGALVYAELLSRFPQDGGDYNFLTSAFGEKVGFLFSWSQITIIQPGSIAAMCFLFANYFTEFLESLSVNHNLTKTALATITLLFLLIINIFSFNSSKLFQNILTFLSILGLLIIISVVFFLPNQSFIEHTRVSNANSPISLSMILILFAYGGWNQIAFVAAEIKDATKNLAKSLIAGIFVVTLLYCLTNFSFLYSLGIQKVRDSNSVATDTLSLILPVASKPLISLIICITCLGSIQAIFFSGARISFTLGKDFSFFKILSTWNNDREGPIYSYFFQTLASLLVLLMTGSFANSIVYTSTIVWILFFLSGLSLFVFRKRDTSVHTFLLRPYPFIPLVFCLSCLYLIYSSFTYDMKGSLISLVIVSFGFLPYYCSRRSLFT